MSHAMEALRRTVPAGAAVLDLGCGPGRHTGYLTDSGLAVRGDGPAAADATGMTGLQEWTTDARAFALVGPVTS